MTDPYGPTGPSDAAQAAETLKTLPSLENTETQVRAAIEQIAAQASAIVPSLTWRWVDEPTHGYCTPPYDKTDGQRILLANFVSDTPIPDERWEQLLAVARETADKLGATKMEVFKDEPGHHDVRFYNQTGTNVRFGSWKAALISGATGCRLPRDKK